MRILGNIDHPKIKITVFQDNNKIIAQCEDGLCQLTYKFREGGTVEGLDSIKGLFDSAFISLVEKQIDEMQSARRSALSRRTAAIEDEFDTII